MGSKSHARSVICGHSDQRHFARGLCRKCYGAEQYKKLLSDPRRLNNERERNRQWRRNHLEIAKKHERESKKRHEIANWSTKLFYKFGITADEYFSLLRAQGNCCAICGLNQGECSQRFAVDHDHQTGKIRGLLCTSCNVGIARYEAMRENTKVEKYLAGVLPFSIVLSAIEDKRFKSSTEIVTI